MSNLPSLEPSTFADMMQFANMLAKSTMIPREYQNQPANIALAIGWGRPLGLSAIQALNAIAVINGKPAMYGDALLALVRGSPLCEDIIEVIKGEGDLATAVCEARRRGAEPVVRAFSVADARKAGLWDKSGPWKQYPMRMLQMRARGFAIRDAWPDLLRGVISAEEARDIPREPKDITPPSGEVVDDLDAFADDGALEDEETLQQAPQEPTDAAIECRQEMIAAVLGPEELARLDLENLLFRARSETFNGRKAFGEWYQKELDDEQRLALRPTMKELQAAAREADKPLSPGA
jgi:hypothetical protein